MFACDQPERSRREFLSSSESLKSRAFEGAPVPWLAARIGWHANMVFFRPAPAGHSVAARADKAVADPTRLL
jgi:hypothetical protein